jgi:hypothetical protein
MESFRLEGIDVVRHVLIGMASASALAAEKTSARRAVTLTPTVSSRG